MIESCLLNVGTDISETAGTSNMVDAIGCMLAVSGMSPLSKEVVSVNDREVTMVDPIIRELGWLGLDSIALDNVVSLVIKDWVPEGSSERLVVAYCDSALDIVSKLILSDDISILDESVVWSSELSVGNEDVDATRKDKELRNSSSEPDNLADD